MKKLLTIALLLLIAVGCTDNKVLPMDDLTLIADSTGEVAKSATVAPVLVGFQNSVYELREYQITNRYWATKWTGKVEMGAIICPFCSKVNIVEVKKFGMCGTLCAGKVPKDSIGLTDPTHMIPCMTRFYQQPLFPADPKLYARFGSPYNSTYYQ